MLAAWTAPVRAAVDRLVRHIGRRGAYLLFLSLIDLVLGYALIQPLPLGLSRQAVYQPFVEIMPLPAWVLCWFVTAALTALAALWHRARPAVFGAAALLKTGWGAGYLAGWLGHYPLYTRGYQTASIFVAFALMTLLISGWRENGR